MAITTKIQLVNKEVIDYYIDQTGDMVWSDQALTVSNNKISPDFIDHTPYALKITDYLECLTIAKWYIDYPYKYQPMLDISMIEINKDYFGFLFVHNLHRYSIFYFPKNHLCLLSSFINENVTNKLPKKITRAVFDIIWLAHPNHILEKDNVVEKSLYETVLTVLNENLGYLKE